MIKLQDFARQSGVSERQVHRLVKKYESELEGLMERKGHNGTWLSDEACEVLRSHMKQQPVTVVTENDLHKEMLELYKKHDKLKDKYLDLQEEHQTLLLENQKIALLEADNKQKEELLQEAEKTAQEATEKLSAFKSMNPREFRKFYKQQRKEERLLKKQEKKQAKSDKTDKE